MKANRSPLVSTPGSDKELKILHARKLKREGTYLCVVDYKGDRHLVTWAGTKRPETMTEDDFAGLHGMVLLDESWKYSALHPRFHCIAIMGLAYKLVKTDNLIGPRRALILGLGAGTLDAYLQARTKALVTNVEYSQAVIEVAQKFFGFRGSYVKSDARAVVRRSIVDSWDYIAADTFPLSTDDYFDDTFLSTDYLGHLHRILRHGGILTANLGECVTPSGRDLHRKFVSAARATGFDSCLQIGPYGRGSHIEMNTVVVLSKGRRLKDAAAIETKVLNTDRLTLNTLYQNSTPRLFFKTLW